MDAEVWSYADTKRGSLILRVLTVLIILKEIAVTLAPWLGLPVIDPVTLPAENLGSLSEFRGVLALLLKLVLVLCLNLGFSWARIGLGLIYLLAAVYALAPLFPPSGLIGEEQMLIIGNAVLGILIGLVLLLSAQLKAYLWRKAATRLIIPIPSEDEPAARPFRRTQSLGERIMGTFRRLVSLAILLAILLIIAHLYGLTGPLLDAFGP
jgi:hypothetical protein